MVSKGLSAGAIKLQQIAARRLFLLPIRFATSQASHISDDPVEWRDVAEPAFKPAVKTVVDMSYPTYMVWGSNTGVGKTLISAGLCMAVFRHSRRRKDVLYLKPVQTGFPVDSDARYVYQEVSRLGRVHPEVISEGLFVSNQTLQVSNAVRSSGHWRNFPSTGVQGAGIQNVCSYESELFGGVQRGTRPEEAPKGKGEELKQSRLTCKTMWAWHDPISPHLAVAREGAAVKDSSVVESVQGLLVALAKGKIAEGESGEVERWAILETAGGVASPAPSGTLQCDLYRYTSWRREVGRDLHHHSCV